MRKGARVAFLSATVLVLSVLLGCSKKSAEENTPPMETEETIVRIGIQPSAAFIPMYVVRYNGWLEDALAERKIVVLWQDFESGPPIRHSLASGNTDIGLLGDVPTVSALVGGQDNVIFGVPANGADAYAVLVSAENSSIKNPSDLKGKKIATVEGSTGHNLVKKICEKEGFSISDVRILNVSTGVASALLENGVVDALSIWEPNVTRLVKNGTARVLVRGSYTNLKGSNSFLARKEFAEKYPAVLSVVLEQFARAIRELDSLDEPLLNLVSDQFRVKKEDMHGILENYSFTVEIGREDEVAWQDTIRFLVGLGFLRVEFDVDNFISHAYFDRSDAASYLK